MKIKEGRLTSTKDIEKKKEGLLNYLANGSIEFITKLDPSKSVWVFYLWPGAGYGLNGFPVSADKDDIYEALGNLGDALVANKLKQYYITEDEYQTELHEIIRDIAKRKGIEGDPTKLDDSEYWELVEEAEDMLRESYISSDDGSEIYIQNENLDTDIFDYDFFMDAVKEITNTGHNNNNGSGGFTRFKTPNEKEVLGYKKFYERMYSPAGVIRVENEEGEEIKNFSNTDIKNVDASIKYLSRHPGGKMVAESKLKVVDEFGKPVSVNPNDPKEVASFLRNKGRKVISEKRVKESFNKEFYIKAIQSIVGQRLSDIEKKNLANLLDEFLSESRSITESTIFSTPDTDPIRDSWLAGEIDDDEAAIALKKENPELSSDDIEETLNYWAESQYED